MSGVEYQREDYWCGPATLHNAAYFLRHNSPGQAKIAGICGTTGELSTDEEDMMRGALYMGLVVDPYSSGSAIMFADWLVSTIRCGAVVALCVDDWEHWVLAFGMLGAHILVHDPANWERNVNNSGIRVYSEKGICTRVKAAKSTAGDLDNYYGIALYKKG